MDTAWGEIRHGLVRAVSIGFRPVKHAYREDGGIDFQEIEIFELSSVSIPANADAVITAVKSIDHKLLESAGVESAALPEIPEPPVPAATVKAARVVKLEEKARDGAKPFVVRDIKRTK